MRGFIPSGVVGSASQTLFYGTSNAGTGGGGTGLSGTGRPIILWLDTSHLHGIYMWESSASEFRFTELQTSVPPAEITGE